jgi:hypothetical protein
MGIICNSIYCDNQLGCRKRHKKLPRVEFAKQVEANIM